jgi:hypothetical protein
MVAKLIAIFAVLLWQLSSAFAGFPSSGSHVHSAVIFNFLTGGFGATCNGVADDATAMMKVGIAMRANADVMAGKGVTLIIPSGSNCYFNSCPISTDNLAFPDPFLFVPNITILATGATMVGTGSACQKWKTDLANISCNFFFYGGCTGVGPFIGRFNASNIGDTCVTMTTSGDETQFPVGRWAIVSGQGLQIQSYPPNYAVFEYVKIASTPTGQICLTKPLKNAYPFLAAYPAFGILEIGFQNNYTTADGLPRSHTQCAGAYCGGQGVIQLMENGWAGYFHVIGGTWTWGNNVFAPAQTTTWENVLFHGSGTGNCPVPTFSQNFYYINTTLECFVEVDKNVENLTQNGGFTSNLQFQSESVESFNLVGGGSSTVNGTPPLFNCDHSEIRSGKWGNTYGGRSHAFSGAVCQFDSDITGIATNAFQIGPGTNPPPLTTFNYLGSGQFHSVGNLAATVSPPPWWDIGATMTFGEGTGSLNSENNNMTVGTAQWNPNPAFLDLVINTTVTGASIPPNTNQGPEYVIDPMRQWTCVSCTGLGTGLGAGAPWAVENSMPYAQNKPLWVYSNRTYTCANNMINVPNSLDINVIDGYRLDGFFVTLTVNVIRANTNPTDIANGSAIQTFGQTHIFNVATGAQGTYTFNVDLTLAGTRSTTAAGPATGTGGADNFFSPGFSTNTWLGGLVNQRSIGGTVTNGPAAQCPVVSVEYKTTR